MLSLRVTRALQSLFLCQRQSLSRSRQKTIKKIQKVIDVEENEVDITHRFPAGVSSVSDSKSLLDGLQDWNNRRQFTPPSDFHADGVNEFFNSQAVTDGSRANEILKQAPFLVPFTSRVKIFHASRYGNDFIVVK
ncbi:hypothetical protein ACOSQ3_019474 [Xanthoceras sorbifolium]